MEPEYVIGEREKLGEHLPLKKKQVKTGGLLDNTESQR